MFEESSSQVVHLTQQTTCVNTGPRKIHPILGDQIPFKKHRASMIQKEWITSGDYSIQNTNLNFSQQVVCDLTPYAGSYSEFRRERGVKLSRRAGQTSQTINIFIADSSSLVGAGLIGLVYNTSGLVAYYVRPRSSPVSITLATQTVTGSYSSGGFVEIDSVNMPGWYRLDVPNGALAASADSVALHLKGATHMAPCPIEIDLDAQVDVQSMANNVLTNSVFDATSGLKPIANGTASAAASTTITIATGLGSNNLQGCIISILSGTGANQSRAISFYNNSTGVATVSPFWWTQPDNTSVYVITKPGATFEYDATGAYASVNSALIKGVVLATPTSGGYLKTDLSRISGDQTSLNTFAQMLDDYVNGFLNVDLQGKILGFSPTGQPSGDIGVRTGDTITKNTALSGYTFPMFLTTLAAGTGISVTAQRSIDGAALTSCTNAVVEISGGIYKINLSAADVNGTVITFLFTGTGCVPTVRTILTQP